MVINMKKYLWKKTGQNWPINIIGILFYSILMVLIIKMSQNQGTPTVLRGVLAQLQLFVAVLFVIIGRKSSYVIFVILLIISFLNSVLYILLNGSADSLPAVFLYLIAGIIITSIYIYKKEVQKHIYTIEEKERKLRKMAYFDGLTDLLNRKTFLEELDVHVEIANNSDKKIYVVFIDIDDFKTINDSYGHTTGDKVLTMISEQMQSVIHEEDVVGRLGGDEIGIIIKHQIKEEDVFSYVERIKESALISFEVENRKINTSLSIGISKCPDDGNTSVELLKKADLAMYRAKRTGKNQVAVYSDFEK